MFWGLVIGTEIIWIFSKVVCYWEMAQIYSVHWASVIAMMNQFAKLNCSACFGKRKNIELQSFHFKHKVPPLIGDSIHWDGFHAFAASGYSRRVSSLISLSRITKPRLHNLSRPWQWQLITKKRISHGISSLTTQHYQLLSTNRNSSRLSTLV